MRIILSRSVAVAFAALLSTAPLLAPAHATDITVKLSPDTQNAIVQLPALLDQCTAGMAMRGDAQTCKSISNFLIGMGNEVKVEAQAAAKAESDKAAADKAAAATPAPAPSSTPTPTPAPSATPTAATSAK
jgi:hypothetical protein